MGQLAPLLGVMFICPQQLARAGLAALTCAGTKSAASAHINVATKNWRAKTRTRIRYFFTTPQVNIEAPA